MSPAPGDRDGDADAALARARSVIARELLDPQRAPVTLGEITLHAHQQRAVARLTNLIRRHGGALLADQTGLGKTFVALAVARDHERVLISCPAALRESWRRALDRTRRTALIVSLEQLSRGGPSLAEPPELVIIDESHHLRNPVTKRYAAAAAVCDRARVLLLSATPVQNRREDLIAQLALFLGEAAGALPDHELARFIVRRDVAESSLQLPVVDGPHWITLQVEDDVLDAIAELPPPVPLADEGEAHALLRYTLLRQWSSSRAALVAGLRGRLARGLALLAALEAGRRPTRQELTSWSYTDDALQLAIPELVAPLGNGAAADRALRTSVESHVGAVRALLDRLRRLPDPDPARADALRAIRLRHPGARIIAFSQYAQTVRSLSRLLMSRDAGVAELTARGGRVAGGRIRRADVLSQLSPGAPAAHGSERIELLVTTDVSSEGLDLQLASTIVHLDLPWNPARLEQRVGRVCRLGAAHDRVFVYALAPPASSERVLDVEHRLRTKLRIAARLVGIGAPPLPDESAMLDSPPALVSALYRLLERWRESVSDVPDALPAVAAVEAPVSGWLALICDGGERLLAADDGSGPTADPRVVTRLAAFAENHAIIAPSDDVASCLAVIESWWRQHVAREQLGILAPEGTRIRARIAARIASLLAVAPRYSFAALATRAAAARRALRVPLGIGAERQLANLAEVESDGEAWLTRLCELAAGRNSPELHREPEIRALILLYRREA